MFGSCTREFCGCVSAFDNFGNKKKTFDFLTFVVFGIELAKLISLFFSVLNRQIKGFSICSFLNGSF